MLLLGGKLCFPTNTGLFLNIGSGSGTVKDTLSGVAQPDRDVTIGQVGLGVRQYIGDSFALPLRLDSESMEMKQTGGTMKDNKAIASWAAVA